MTEQPHPRHVAAPSEAILDELLRFIAPLAMEAMRRRPESLQDVIQVEHSDRLRHCANEECRWMILDSTRNGTRTWCHSTLCGNKMRVRRFRARQQGLFAQKPQSMGGDGDAADAGRDAHLDELHEARVLRGLAARDAQKLRWRFDQRHVAQAHQRHVQRSRNRRSGKR